MDITYPAINAIPPYALPDFGDIIIPIFRKISLQKIRCSDRDELYATLCSRRHFLQFNWRVSWSVSVLNGLCAAMVGIAALVHRNFGWRLRFSATLTMGTKEINDAGELTPEYHKRFRLQ